MWPGLTPARLHLWEQGHCTGDYMKKEEAIRSALMYKGQPLLRVSDSNQAEDVLREVESLFSKV